MVHDGGVRAGEEVKIAAWTGTECDIEIEF